METIYAIVFCMVVIHGGTYHGDGHTCRASVVEDTGLELEKVHRRSNLPTDTILELQGIGERWGVSVEETNESLSEFGDLMAQTSRNAPQALQRWLEWPELYEALGRQLQGLSRKQQLEKVFSFLGRMSSIDQKRRALTILRLPEDWAYFTQAELEQARGEEMEWATLRGHPHFNSAEACQKYVDNTKLYFVGKPGDRSSVGDRVYCASKKQNSTWQRAS